MRKKIYYSGYPKIYLPNINMSLYMEFRNKKLLYYRYSNLNVSWRRFTIQFLGLYIDLFWYLKVLHYEKNKENL